MRQEVLTLVALIPAVGVIYLVLKYQLQFDPFLRISNLLGTLFHEAAGHSFFTLISGGHVTEFVINPDGSGFANIAGGNWALSLPAGYMVTTLLTAVMFLVNNRTKLGEVIPFILGVALLVMTLMLGARLENGVTASGITTILVGIVGSLFLIYVGWHREHHWPLLKGKYGLSNPAWMFIVNVICMYFGLGGILSLQYISWHAEHGNIDDISRFTDAYYPTWDPKTMAALLMWISIAFWLLCIFISLRYIFRKLREEE